MTYIFRVALLEKPNFIKCVFFQENFHFLYMTEAFKRALQAQGRHGDTPGHYTMNVLRCREVWYFLC